MIRFEFVGTFIVQIVIALHTQVSRKENTKTSGIPPTVGYSRRLLPKLKT